MLPVPLLRLQCGVQCYDWGKKGGDSAVARFASATPSELTVQHDQPYAELWMGTHPSNPSRDLATGRSLVELVKENQQLLSPSVTARYGRKLPFLFKVLSIQNALSIQAHPDKKLAEQLHARDPDHYPDDNHKPEMTVAITPSEALCGFRPLGEIAHFFQHVPALGQLAGEDVKRAFVETVARNGTSESDEARSQNTEALRILLTALMSASEAELAAASERLVMSAAGADSDFAGGGVTSTAGSVLAELVNRLHAHFGPDHGLFVLFLLNYVRLQPGEALYLRANDIHAYVSGDMVECMASSDNVVRAGLTSKFKDVGTLLGMLTYGHAPAEEQKMRPSEYPYVKLNRAAYGSGSAVLLYDPPIDEFAVVRTLLRGPAAKATFEALDGPSVVLCTAGRGRIAVGHKVEEVREGYVFFVGSTAECVLESDSESGEDDEFVTFRAFCEVEDSSNGA